MRNHRASNNLKAMKRGEQALFYHSVTGKEIVGIAEISEEGLADPKAPDGPWAAVRLKPARALDRPVTLAAIKARPELAEVELVRLSRLSVAELKPTAWKQILALAKG